MSNYEAEARYEHATTLVDWFFGKSEPPEVLPPDDEPGWVLLSQHQAPDSAHLQIDGDAVTRFLCVWRRRLTKQHRASRSQKRVYRDETVREAQAKQRKLDEEAKKKERDARIADAETRFQEVYERELKIANKVWNIVRHLPGVRALAWNPAHVDVDAWRNDNGIVHQELTLVTFDQATLSSIGETMHSVHKNALFHLLQASLDKHLPTVRIRMSGWWKIFASQTADGKKPALYERGAIFKGGQLVGESVTISASKVSEPPVSADDDDDPLAGSGR